MKKFVYASFVAAASLGLAACAEPEAENEMVEEGSIDALPDEEVMGDAPVMDEMDEGMDDTMGDDGEPVEPVASIDPNGDASGPRPNDE